jgi:hypothetical protein
MHRLILNMNYILDLTYDRYRSRDLFIIDRYIFRPIPILGYAALIASASSELTIAFTRAFI